MIQVHAAGSLGAIMSASAGYTQGAPSPIASVVSAMTTLPAPLLFPIDPAPTSAASTPGALDDVDVRHRAETAIATLMAALTTRVCCLAWSGGKDSTAAAALTLTALLRLRLSQPEAVLLPLYVTTGDTEVENPHVLAEAHDALDLLREWALGAGLDVRIISYKPRLADTFVVNVLSGAMLPTYAGHRRRQCTFKWKLDPAAAALRNLIRDLRQELAGAAETGDPIAMGRLDLLSADPTPVVILGTRHDESTIRSANMRKRGESAERIVEHDGRHLLSPIADWCEDEVWEFLAIAGTAPNSVGADAAVPYPVWRPDFAAVIQLYRDAAGGECPVVAGAGKAGRAGCGARTGCHTCVQIASDRSLEAMATDPRYHHVRPLLDIRNFLAAIQYDMSHRTWVTRQVVKDRISGKSFLKVQPHHFTSETLQTIIGAYMTADRNEARRADAFDHALRAGRLPVEDPYVARCLAEGVPPAPAYLERMRRPQFQVINAQKAVGLDFYSAVLLSHRRPFTVLELWHRVWRQGETITVPTIAKHPPIRIPAARWIEIPEGATPDCYLGLSDPMVTMHEPCWEAQDLHSVDGNVVAAVEAPAFDVDEEAAGLIVDLLYPDDLRDRHLHPDPLAFDPVRTYLAMGVVHLSPAGRAHLNRIIKHRAAVHAAGFYDLPADTLYHMAQAPAPVTETTGSALDSSGSPPPTGAVPAHTRFEQLSFTF